MIFTPLVIFWHTWEFDSNTNVLDALIERHLFFKYFHIENESVNTDLISVSIQFNSYYPKQLKVSYQLSLFRCELLLSVDKEKLITIPNIDEEFLAKHLFNWMVNNSSKKSEIQQLIHTNEQIYNQHYNQYRVI